jgi:glycerol-3-phosphate dehydrogenase
MPIAEAVDAIVNRDADIGRAIAELLSRPFKAEAGGG